MNEQDAFNELLNAVRDAVPHLPGNFRWVAPNRLAFLKTWQVQARFVQEPHRYSIFLERFGAELGNINYEPTPGSGEPKQTVLTMHLEISGGAAFWRLADTRIVKSDVLARWVIDRLPLFHDEYGRAATRIGF
jgi:hypothetical protein